MNKTEERKLFDKIFSSDEFSDVQETEIPDFVCIKEDKPVLGAEVTELHLNEGAARLEKIPDYTLEILNGGEYRHKQDVDFLPVGKIRYSPKDKQPQEIQAIVTKYPSVEERIGLLRDVIKQKAEKLHEYKKKAEYIDLIIDDRGPLLRINDPEKAAKLFLGSHLLNVVLESGFREIHLVTETVQNTAIIVPAKFNVMVEEVLRCEYAIAEVYKQQSQKLTVGSFGVHIGRYLADSGFPEVRTFLVDNEIVVCTSVGYSILGKKRRELIDSIGVRDFGSDNEFPDPPKDDPSGDSVIHNSIVDLARERTFNISITKAAQGAGAIETTKTPT